MKIYNIKNIDKFLATLEECKGNVYLITDEGDRLNLKSKLCQFVMVYSLLSAEVNVPEMQIIADEAADTLRIANFLVGM